MMYVTQQEMARWQVTAKKCLTEWHRDCKPRDTTPQLPQVLVMPGVCAQVGGSGGKTGLSLLWFM